MQRLVVLSASLLFAAAAHAQATRPAVGTIANPRQITSADVGPDVDPAKVAASPYDGIPMFGTFRSFMSSAYAINDVWLYAVGLDEKNDGPRVEYLYPNFYKPTWGEVFDHVARQMKYRWAWDAKVRQFRFEPSDAAPFFGVDLADGWRREDRGLYVWHAPADGKFGMDIYYYGHFAPAVADAAFAARVREHFALRELADWPTPPTLKEMTSASINGVEALALRIDTPRPGGVWRQWSLVVDGHAFVIVSAMPKAKEATLAPQVDRMVQTFALRPAASTRPAEAAR